MDSLPPAPASPAHSEHALEQHVADPHAPPTDISIILELIGSDLNITEAQLPAAPSAKAEFTAGILAQKEADSDIDSSDGEDEDAVAKKPLHPENLPVAPTETPTSVPIVVDTAAVEDDSSSDSSSDSEPDLPRPARKGRAASDDEDDEPTTATALATAHEIVKPPISVPTITEVGPEEHIVHVGEVMSVIDSVVVVKGMPRGEKVVAGQVLDTDSLLVFEDRKVLGQVFETFGPLVLPMYSIRFPDAKSIDPETVTVGRRVFNVPGRSFYVAPGALNTKGSDASNFYDEEPGDDEVEFSDDEQEQEHKRAVNAKRKARLVSRQPGYGGNPDAGPMDTGGDDVMLSYDDASEAGQSGGTSMDTTPDSRMGSQPRQFVPRGRGRGRGRGQPSRGRPPPSYNNQGPPQGFSPGGQGSWSRSTPGPPAQGHYQGADEGYSPFAAGAGFIPHQQPQFQTQPQQQLPYPPLQYTQQQQQQYHQSQQQLPGQQGFNYGFQTGMMQPFVAPHINPRFASQFGFGQMAQMPMFGQMNGAGGQQQQQQQQQQPPVWDPQGGQQQNPTG